MKKFILKIGMPDYKVADRKVWLRAGFATEMEEDGAILCTLSLVPVTGWDGQFKLFPADEPNNR